MEIFVLGFIFGTIILPLLEGFSSVILSFFEMLKSYIGVVIYSNSKKVNAPETATHVIGFACPDEEEFYDNDDL